MQSIILAADKFKKDLLRAMKDASDDIQGDIKGLERQMNDMKINDSAQASLVLDFQSTHEAALSKLLSTIETITAAEIYSRQEAVRKAQGTILATLSFPGMNRRHEQIHPSFENTYGWILQNDAYSVPTARHFRTWLDGSDRADGTYWISGKPGSGKSTLMQYLGRHVSDTHCLPWLRHRDLFVCNFFLWKLGENMQNNFHGMLQALLYQILSEHQWVIESVVNKKRWSLSNSADLKQEWTVLEMKDALAESICLLSATKGILMLIDGLDELEGTDDDRHDMLSLLKRLADLESLKLCVASRPWNIFSDEFRNCPQLRLQDMTRNDIQVYVRQSLGESIARENEYLKNIDAGNKLIDAITEKADGVFLWVRLVVQELLRGFRDGETIRTLMRKVDAMPADLDAFFKRMLDSIDPAYRRESSAYLQTALFCLDNTEAERKGFEWRLKLLELSYLDIDDVDFAIKPGFDFSELALNNLKCLEYRIDLAKRRLNSRCMGLLECYAGSDLTKGTSSQSSQIWQQCNIQCNFIHLTLADYLRKDEAQCLLRPWTGGKFLAENFLCSAMIANASLICAMCVEDLDTDSPFGNHWPEILCPFLEEVFLAIRWLNNQDVDRVDAVLGALMRPIHFLQEYYNERPTGMAMETITCKLLRDSGNSNHPRMRIAVAYSLVVYVENRLTAPMMQEESTRGNPLLLLALKAATCPLSQPWIHGSNLQTIHLLLRKGSDPNEICEGSMTPWHTFLASLYGLSRVRVETFGYSQPFADVMALMIKYGAAHTIPTKALIPDEAEMLDCNTPRTDLIALTKVIPKLPLNKEHAEILLSLLRDTDPGQPQKESGTAKSKKRRRKLPLKNEHAEMPLSLLHDTNPSQPQKESGTAKSKRRRRPYNNNSKKGKHKGS
jgi:hypothetical protein